VLAIRLLDRPVSSLVFGSGLLFAAFDLANKQSFENQWLLVCQLLVLGLACSAAERAGAERAAAQRAPAAEPAPPADPPRRPAFRHEGADVP